MQIDCYGLREHPFKMSPDARLYFASKAHSRAYAHLLFGLSQKEGFIVVTGEVGAGKTTLIERLCTELPAADHAIARVMTTQVEADDLLRLVAVAFGAEAEGNKPEILRAITARLWAGITERGMRHILIVDEAQALPVPALEELRMLSNITEGERALLQVVLMGQPQLRRTLARPDLDQLRQRILAAYHLGALTREETHQYIRHRMTAVGWTGTPEWQPGALDVVHRFTDGIPRRINRLCSRILLSGSLEGRTTLTAELAEATALELDQDLGEIVATTEPEPEERGLLDAIRALEDRITNLEHLTAGRERLLRRIQDLVDRAEAARAAQ
jgi:type II secretory pathway predicted ATPase ExeA